MDENPIFGTMNMTIAGAQVLKGVKASAEAARLYSPEWNSTIEGAAKSIKNLSEKSKVVKYGGTLQKNINIIPDDNYEIIKITVKIIKRI